MPKPSRLVVPAAQRRVVHNMRLACLVLLGAARVASQSCASTHAHDADTLECEEWCDTSNLAKHCSFCKCGACAMCRPPAPFCQ